MSYNIIDEFNDIFYKPFSSYEILLNITFLLIIGIIFYIFYWDLINRKVKSISKCKNNINKNNTTGGVYVINAKDDANNNLYSIKYDMVTNKPSIDCKCTPGTYMNTFKNIKIYDPDKEETIGINNNCSCDKTYELNANNHYYNGEPFLLKYMYDNNPYNNGYDQSQIKYPFPIFPNNN